MHVYWILTLLSTCKLSIKEWLWLVVHMYILIGVMQRWRFTYSTGLVTIQFYFVISKTIFVSNLFLGWARNTFCFLSYAGVLKWLFMHNMFTVTSISWNQLAFINISCILEYYQYFLHLIVWTDKHHGQWILGGGWNNEFWGGDFPVASWSDDISLDNPVCFQTCELNFFWEAMTPQVFSNYLSFSPSNTPFSLSKTPLSLSRFLCTTPFSPLHPGV
jgi:hypothetical protein